MANILNVKKIRNWCIYLFLLIFKLSAGYIIRKDIFRL